MDSDELHEIMSGLNAKQMHVFELYTKLKREDYLISRWSHHSSTLLSLVRRGLLRLDIDYIIKRTVQDKDGKHTVFKRKVKDAYQQKEYSLTNRGDQVCEVLRMRARMTAG